MVRSIHQTGGSRSSTLYLPSPPPHRRLYDPTRDAGSSTTYLNKWIDRSKDQERKTFFFFSSSSFFLSFFFFSWQVWPVWKLISLVCRSPAPGGSPSDKSMMVSVSLESWHDTCWGDRGPLSHTISPCHHLACYVHRYIKLSLFEGNWTRGL